MKTTVNEQQVQQYQDDGFLVVEDFLNTDELEAMRSAVTGAVAEMGEQRVSGPKRDDLQHPDEYYANVFVQKLNLWKINRFIRSFFLNPELGELMCRLENIDGIRMWHDQTLQKKPWGNPTAWHLDNPYWSFHSRHAISVWIALDDATAENGCMYFLKGSHKIADPEKNVGIGRQLDALMTANPEFAKLEVCKAAMKAGTASFHNGLTAHGAGANMTAGWRRAMTCAYMPEGATFNGRRNILPADYFESLTIGDVLESEEQNPLLWSARTLAGV